MRKVGIPRPCLTTSVGLRLTGFETRGENESSQLVDAPSSHVGSSPGALVVSADVATVSGDDGNDDKERDTRGLGVPERSVRTQVCSRDYACA